MPNVKTLVCKNLRYIVDLHSEKAERTENKVVKSDN